VLKSSYYNTKNYVLVSSKWLSLLAPLTPTPLCRPKPERHNHSRQKGYKACYCSPLESKKKIIFSKIKSDISNFYYFDFLKSTFYEK
jgi:hypothetical protein